MLHFNRLDLNLLVALDALLAEKNVTKAGERLYRSQPAMSGALQRLREYFDDELLVKVGRKMELTPRAEFLAGPVREILLQIQTTVESQPEFDPSTIERDFSVVMSDYVSYVLMPEVSRQLRSMAPGVRLHHDERLLDSHVLLAAGDVDLVVMPPGIFTHDKALFHQEFLFNDQWVCVMSSDNPAARESLTLESFLEMSHVLIRATATDRTRSVEELRLQALGLDIRNLNVAATAPGFVPLLLLIPGSNAVAMVQQRLFDAFSKMLDITAVAPPVQIPAVNVHMFWSKRVAFDPAQIWLRDLFQKSAKALH